MNSSLIETMHGLHHELCRGALEDLDMRDAKEILLSL